MGDEVSAALRAAALAGMNHAERDHADRFHGGAVGPGHIGEASRTVAAFLRALPSTPHEFGLPCPETACRLAAAVEAEARRAGGAA